MELLVEVRRSFKVESTAQRSGATGEGYEGYPGRREAERGERARRESGDGGGSALWTGCLSTRKGEQPLQKGDAGIDESWSRQLMQWSEPTALP